MQVDNTTIQRLAREQRISFREAEELLTEDHSPTVIDEREHDADCTCGSCCPEPVDAEERYIHED